jgi:ABC-type multidrug transport system fused ATPase/permease subunit
MRIVGENVVAKMRDDMTKKQQFISLRYFSEGEIGRIMSRLINDANTVRIFIRQGLTQILVDTTSILGSLVVVFLLNVKLATIAVAILPVCSCGSLVSWVILQEGLSKITLGLGWTNG